MYKVIVPILNPNTAEDMVHLATTLSGVSSGKTDRLKVTVLGVVVVPTDTPLSQGASLVKAYRTMLRYIPPENNNKVEVRTEVRVAREVWQGIVEQVHEEGANLLLLHWKGATQTPGAIYGSTIDMLMRDTPCDIVLARFNGFKPAKNILLPVRGSGYSSLALKLASHISEVWGSKLTVLHSFSQLVPGTVESPTDLSDYSPAYTDSFSVDNSFNASEILSELPPGAGLLTVQGEPTTSILREVPNYDMVVVGASGMEGKPSGENESMAIRLSRRLETPLLVVKANRLLPVTKPGAPHRDDERLAEMVDQWFAQNTFRYREFRSMSSLTLLKASNNLSISLVFPVYGKVQPMNLAENIRRARFALMRDCALVDEIIISAPGSLFDPDELTLLGAGEGEEVIYVHSDSPHPPEQSNGPGEALWHAMRKARGDIVVWADPSVSGFEPRHIYGLVGPLLTYTKFAMSCGFFSEEDENDFHPVMDELAELSIRPLLSGFFPRLSGVINPLCLVGAARRDSIERLPFFTESGFMPGLLIDATARNGLMSLAQIDLGAPSVSVCSITPQRTSAEVMEVLLRRIEDRAQVHLSHYFNPALKAIRRENGVFSLRVVPQTSPVRELPPPIFAPGYYRNQF
ncbi:universal stress protein [Candidatus Chlorohelix sp.]|uniref:universal stress protein n=1 Tax=Candidatus Chlorohelix sp. TaxID=3139201 RepID=UPI0030629715